MLLGKLIDRLLPAMPGTALLVRGAPGIGKTEAALARIKNEGHATAKFIAAQETPESVAGFLWIDQSTNSCQYLPPRRLRNIQGEMGKNKVGVVIIDEYKSGERMTHNSLQQLIREHEVGDWVAGGKMYVIALTNRDEDRANTIRLSAPTINRFVQIEVEADFEFWSNWAGTVGIKENRIHPDVLGFLRAIFIGGEGLKSDKAKEYAKNKDLLFCSPAPKDESSFPTPRSWELASDVLTKFPGEDGTFILEVLSGCVGGGAAHEFIQWQKIGKKAHEVVERILNGHKVPSMDVGMTFFVNTQIASAYARNAKGTADHVTKYLADIESEYAMWLINDLASISDKITKTSDWMKVVMKHKKVAIAGKR
jgi:hypothetical protein